MKIFRVIVSFLNLITLKWREGIELKSSKVYFAFIRGFNKNSVSIVETSILTSKILINGESNVVKCERALISDCLITIQGKNNRIELAPGVKLRRATIVIRGNNCSIEIGKNSSFGQIRIVNVGMDNSIKIGADCLFADNIELWASDTHTIFDHNDRLINPEKPIIIGDSVWVGAYVKILKGVSVGNGSIIGMNSMVTKDILPKTLNVGSPAKCIKSNVTWSLEYLKYRTE